MSTERVQANARCVTLLSLVCFTKLELSSDLAFLFATIDVLYLADKCIALSGV
jgi:hypothetical protein